MERTNIVYLHTGSNLGDRFANLEKVNALIGQRIGRIVAISALYETEAWGVTEQPLFINQALCVQTELSAASILSEINKIEAEMGRIRIQKWTERLIDVDVLFYNDAVIHSPSLDVPHPRIAERNFVLVPMAEIAPDWLHPIFQKTMKQLLAETTDDLKVYAIRLAI